MSWLNKENIKIEIKTKHRELAKIYEEDISAFVNSFLQEKYEKKQRKEQQEIEAPRIKKFLKEGFMGFKIYKNKGYYRAYRTRKGNNNIMIYLGNLENIENKILSFLENEKNKNLFSSPEATKD